MSEPKGVTLEDVAKFIEAEEWVQPAALVRAADRVVAAARKRCKRPDGSGCDCELCRSIVEFDRAGGG